MMYILVIVVETGLNFGIVRTDHECVYTTTSSSRDGTPNPTVSRRTAMDSSGEKKKKRKRKNTLSLPLALIFDSDTY